MTRPRMQRTRWNRRLLASTRGRILALLRTEHRTVNELAAALRLTDNAVRAQLLSLERDGLIQQHGIRRGKRKPHAAYGLSDEAENIFPKAYGVVLNDLVTVISRRFTPRVMRSVMKELGRAVAREHVDRLKGLGRHERIKAALDQLHDLGGAAQFVEIDGNKFIHGRNGCPLAAVTANHPEACLIVEALLSSLIGIPVKKCCESGEKPRCCFELGR